MHFSFCGVDCRDLHLDYIPAVAERTPSLPSFDVRSETPTYRHGGYYFGYQIKPREFTVACFFEDITKRQFEDIQEWVLPGTQGKQVFSERPLVYYDATVTATPSAEMYQDGDKYSGTINFSFTAYEPFGKLSAVSSEEEDDYSGLLPRAMMPANNFRELGTHLIYNPGIFETDTLIRIGGSAPDGVTIRNDTTGDVCKFLRLFEAPEYLEVDSRIGTIKRLPAYPDGLFYSVHDYGYIRLAPGNARKNVPVSWEDDSNVIHTTSFFTENDEGRYIYLKDKWLRIANVNDGKTAIVSERLSESGEADATIVTMNEIRIEGTNVSLSKMEIEYVPYVR